MTHTLKTPPPAPFYFIRHGQTDWNKEQRTQGQTDIPLNQTGIIQAEAAARALADIEFTKIISSPLQRALHTARIIARTTNKPLSINSDLRECSWGIMEGNRKGDAPSMESWKRGAPVQGAEPWSDFVERIRKGLTDVLHEDEPVLIVAHGGVYWAIREVLHIPEQHIGNCQPLLHLPPQSATDSWSVQELDQTNTLAGLSVDLA